MNDNKHRIILTIIIFLIIPTLFATDMKLFYFNPDGKSNAPGPLISKSTTYFEKVNKDIKIQPLAQFGPLQALLQKQSKSLVIMPYWSYELLYNKMDITPILIPAHEKDDYTYTKALLIKKGKLSKIEDLKGKKVATTSLGTRTIELLNQIFFNQYKCDASDINFIFVKKDIDAILAVKFGRVYSALIVPRTFDSLKKTRPFIVKGLDILAQSQPINETPLFLKGTFAGDEKKDIKDTFINMSRHEDGKKLINFLGFKKWIEFPEGLLIK